MLDNIEYKIVKKFLIYKSKIKIKNQNFNYYIFSFEKTIKKI